MCHSSKKRKSIFTNYRVIWALSIKLARHSFIKDCSGFDLKLSTCDCLLKARIKALRQKACSTSTDTSKQAQPGARAKRVSRIPKGWVGFCGPGTRGQISEPMESFGLKHTLQPLCYHKNVNFKAETKRLAEKSGYL